MIFKVRIGDYRAIIRLEDDKIAVTISGHRKDVYRNFQSTIVVSGYFYAGMGVVTGNKAPRGSGDEATIFDSTGLATQDVDSVWRVYEKTLNENLVKK